MRLKEIERGAEGDGKQVQEARGYSVRIWRLLAAKAVLSRV